MSMSDEYYDHILKRKPATSLAKNILFEVLEDAVIGRNGFDDIWGNLDDETQEEIFETNLEIIQKNLQNSD